MKILLMLDKKGETMATQSINSYQLPLKLKIKLRDSGCKSAWNWSFQKQSFADLFKIGVLKNFRKFHREKPVLESLMKYLQAFNFIKKRLQHRCFRMNIAKFLRTPCLQNVLFSEHLLWLLLSFETPFKLNFNPNKAGLFEDSFFCFFF